MSNEFNRRSFLKSSLIAASLGWAALANISKVFAQAGPKKPTKPVDPKDQTAAALHYVHDAKKADAKFRTADKKTEFCHNCNFVLDTKGEWRGCQVIQTGLVNQNGWCVGWAKKV